MFLTEFYLLSGFTFSILYFENPLLEVLESNSFLKDLCYGFHTEYYLFLKIKPEVV